MAPDGTQLCKRCAGALYIEECNAKGPVVYRMSQEGPTAVCWKHAPINGKRAKKTSLSVWGGTGAPVEERSSGCMWSDANPK